MECASSCTNTWTLHSSIRQPWNFIAIEEAYASQLLLPRSFFFSPCEPGYEATLQLLSLKKWVCGWCLSLLKPLNWPTDSLTHWRKKVFVIKIMLKSVFMVRRAWYRHWHWINLLLWGSLKLAPANNDVRVCSMWNSQLQLSLDAILLIFLTNQNSSRRGFHTLQRSAIETPCGLSWFHRPSQLWVWAVFV